MTLSNLADQTALLCIDLQPKLVQVTGGERLVQQALKTLKICRELGVSVFAIEQVPQKLGATCEELSEFFTRPAFAKTKFSAYEILTQNLQLPKSVLLCGVEAHICLFQTALDLLDAGFEVSVLGDVCASRNERDAQMAFENLRSFGAKVLSVECWAFLRLQSAQNEHFKNISNIIK